MTIAEAELARLRRRGFALEYVSMAWMTAEAAVAIVSGIIASSIALVGFGLDSVIEFAAAAVVIWQLRGTVSEERESRALRLIGITSGLNSWLGWWWADPAAALVIAALAVREGLEAWEEARESADD